MEQDCKDVDSNACHSYDCTPPIESPPDNTIRISTSTSTTTLNSQAKHRSTSMFNFRRKKKDPSTGAATDSGIPPAMKDKHNIDPADGKTKACNRTKTFETFVDGDQLGVAREQKKTGHTWELVRGLGRLRARLGKGGRKGTRGG